MTALTTATRRTRSVDTGALDPSLPAALRRVEGGGAFAVVEARSEERLAQAATLIREFVAWCRVRYRERPRQIDAYFRERELSRELASLGRTYAPPDGALLLAVVGRRAVGCVALRTIGDGVCEMKRFYVRPECQGLGFGRMLAEALVDLARELGFRTMRLETGDLQTEARSLYRSLGFRRIEPYHDCPEELRRYLVFMERDL